MSASRSVTVVVPTYREVGNIPILVARLEGLRASAALDLDLVLVDDDSQDGTEAVVRALARPWVTLVVRARQRGLSTAVLEGLSRARGEVLVVMDADLSHPPERIPDLVRALGAGADLAVGSRYVAGGSTDAAWTWYRRLNSGVAGLLARPITSLRDPMSGFFALRRDTFLAARGLDPVGYKIGLELLVKCPVRQVSEIPIHFADRRLGKSKLSLREQVNYLRHLARLYAFRLRRARPAPGAAPAVGDHSA